MKKLNSRKLWNEKADGSHHLPFWSGNEKNVIYVTGAIFLFALVMFFQQFYVTWKDNKLLREQQLALEEMADTIVEEDGREGTTEDGDWVILPEYREIYEQNQDFIGWLTVEDTMIDYPVMQTPEDENYYLYRGFNKEENQNGSLIMDTDSIVGVGTAVQDYEKGENPSSNLIIHGHTMKSGEMFGKLQLYKEAEYGMEHNIIKFDSLYEKREYELISVFYSQVFYEDEDVFKYYKFFQADTEEEFKDWYGNIKSMALYDTGVTAEFGDEFITLSCCAYHVEDGRFVVIGKRIK